MFQRFRIRKGRTLLYTNGLVFASLMNPIRSKELAAVVLAGALCGCVEGPQAAESNYGARLSINYRQTIRDHMDPLFFYWKTAQYKFTKPYPGWFHDPEELGGKIHYGYEVDVLINARNSNSKYIGFMPYTFLFRDNFLIRELSPETGAMRSNRPYED